VLDHLFYGFQPDFAFSRPYQAAKLPQTMLGLTSGV